MAVKKTKAKDWFDIVAPKLFNDKIIGRTMVGDPKKLIGRRVILSLMELTNNFSKYYMKFTFRLTNVDGNKAFTEFDSSECMRDYISRMILRRIRRVDAIQDLKTKDGVKVRVKGLAIISRRVKSSVEGIIRKDINETIKREVENSTLDELIEKLMNDEAKSKVLRSARRIYPVRNFEIRKLEVLSRQ